jgi:hypothetical protein
MLTRLKTQRTGHKCDNQCTYGANNAKVPRLATHAFWILGRPIYLCNVCVKGGWTDHYFDAAENWADERQAA